MPRFIIARTVETLAGGVLFGVAIAAVAGAACFYLRRKPPIAGYLVAVGFVSAFADRLGPTVLIGLVLLAAAGLTPRTENAFVAPLASVPGAALVGLGASADWRGALAAVAIVAAGAAATDFAHAHDSLGLPTIFFTVATMGAWLEIPDVDRILVLLGICLPLVFLVWPRVLVTMGASATVWVALLVWTAVDGGSTRPASVVGTVATLGLLLVEPVVRRTTGHAEGMFHRVLASSDPPWHVVVPTVAQGGLALLVSRTAGIQDSTLVAVALAVALLTVASFGLFAANRTADLY